MRVSEAVIDGLRAGGIDAVFGIPGTQSLPLNEAIEATDGMRFVMARHETAVSHQAWGYAETTDGMAATLVIPGPGDMNAMNGLKNALNDTAPLLHIAVETEPEVRGGDGIHETPPDTYDNAVKANITVDTAASTPAELERAIRLARTPPQGPVRIGIPRNFLMEEVGTVATADPGGSPVGDVDGEALDRAADLLAGADAPVVVAGGGVRRSGASAALRAVAESLDAPVVTTMKGKGTVSDDHDLAAGVLSSWEPGVRSLFEESDAALAVGTDLDATQTGQWRVPMPADLVHVTLQPADLGRGYEPAVGLVGDARAVLEGIATRLDEPTSSRDGPSDATRDGASAAAAVWEARQRRIDDLPERGDCLRSPDVLEAAQEVIPRDAVVAADGGGLRIWMNAMFEAYEEGAYVQPGSWATMGTALPSAIGAAVADDDRDIVALIGDGGLMMSLHELHTVVAEDLPIATLVTNNHGFAIISEAAEQGFDIEEGAYDWDGAPIDFTAVAEGMGMRATTVETAAGVRDALAEAIAADEPMLVEVPTEANEPQAHLWLAEE